MNYQALSNNRLVRECAKHPPNEQAWREFVHRFDDIIHFYALRQCQNKTSSHEKKQLSEIVQDRVGEVYAKLVTKKHKALADFIGRNENSIYVYLGIITRNIVLNWVFREKKTRSRPYIDRSIHDSAEHTPSAERNPFFGSQAPEIFDTFNLQHQQHEIDLLLNSYLRGKNKNRNKLIFKMHFYQDLTAQEIVDGLPYGMSLKTVQNILSHLKKIVQDGLTGRKRESN